MPFTYATGSRPLDGYTIRHAIGRGGFGEVYYAISDGGKEVALKLIRDGYDTELRGIQACLNLKHPNLVAIYDVRESPAGEVWLLMEHIAGGTLADTIKRHPQGMAEADVRAWFEGICDAVAYLHNRGIVHRDLKPANIFIEDGVVKVGDYGLSKFIAASQKSGHTEAIGSVHYMAPEVAQGRYGKQIDLYSLGIILYEMLSGRVPFQGESPAEIMMRHLTQEPDLSAAPAAFRNVIAGLLKKDPAERYASTHDVLRALRTQTSDNCYRNGQGVAKDAQEAVKWYRKAAAQGGRARAVQSGLLL